MVISSATNASSPENTIFELNPAVLSKQIKNVTLTAWSGNNGNSGFGLGYEGDNFAVGVETIRDALADENTLEFKNKGVAIHGQVSFKNFTVIVEQVTTSGDTAAEIKHKERQLYYHSMPLK
jgi:hypothetical protein